jgi:hypothetical protein
MGAPQFGVVISDSSLPNPDPVSGRMPAVGTTILRGICEVIGTRRLAAPTRTRVSDLLQPDSRPDSNVNDPASGPPILDERRRPRAVAALRSRGEFCSALRVVQENRVAGRVAQTTRPAVAPKGRAFDATRRTVVARYGSSRIRDATPTVEQRPRSLPELS